MILGSPPSCPSGHWTKGDSKSVPSAGSVDGGNVCPRRSRTGGGRKHTYANGLSGFINIDPLRCVFPIPTTDFRKKIRFEEKDARGQLFVCKERRE